MNKFDQISTFDSMMQNLDFKAKFDGGYQEFLLGELLIAIMENDQISVDQLAKYAQISRCFAPYWTVSAKIGH